MSYTIVITCKNKIDLLIDLLNKIESIHPIEIIVFDIDSLDNRIEKLCNKYDKYNLRRIATNHMGMANCLDMGISVARYNNVIYCQDDITPTPYCFDALYETYINQNEYVLLSPNIYEGDKLEGTDIMHITNDMNYSGRLFACFIINKIDYLKLGRLDINFYPVYYEDRDFLYRIYLNDLKVGSVLDISVEHKGGATIKPTGNYEGNLARNADYYSQKWGGPPNNEKYVIPFDGQRWGKW